MSRVLVKVSMFADPIPVSEHEVEVLRGQGLLEKELGPAPEDVTALPSELEELQKAGGALDDEGEGDGD